MQRQPLDSTRVAPPRQAAQCGPFRALQGFLTLSLLVFALQSVAAAPLCAQVVPQTVQPPGSAVLDASTIPAPTKLYYQPNVSDVVTLTGDYATMRYSVGHLDRAARLQFRLEPQMRILGRWMNTKVDLTTYVFSRAHWEQARFSMPYGIPVRIGRVGIAAPAESDDGSFQTWGSLGVTLPNSTTSGFRGTPEEAANIVMADFVTQLLASEVLVDQTGLAGDKHWVRGLMTHLVMVRYFEKQDEESLRDIELFYKQVIESKPRKMLAASDYHPEISLGDWIWFQARFHYGARILTDKEGRGVFGAMQKIRRRNGDVLTAGALLDKYKDLAEWYYDGFAGVSTRPLPGS